MATSPRRHTNRRPRYNTKNHSASLIVRETQIRATTRHRLTPIGMSPLRETESRRRRRGPGDTGGRAPRCSAVPGHAPRGPPCAPAARLLGEAFAHRVRSRSVHSASDAGVTCGSVGRRTTPAVDAHGGLFFGLKKAGDSETRRAGGSRSRTRSGPTCTRCSK